jgi:hypothetical protein
LEEQLKILDRLDKLLSLIITGALFVPTIANAYHLDARFSLIPIITYVSFIIYRAFVRPRIISANFNELAILEGLRGWTYVGALAVTLIGNFLMLSILPRTITVYIIGVPIISTILIWVVAIIPRTFFRNYLIYTTKEQEKETYKILREVGSASIFFSVGVLLVNMDISDFLIGNEHSLYESLLTFFVVLALFLYGFYRERQATKLIHELAISLFNSGFSRKLKQRKHYLARPRVRKDKAKKQ